ncbi:hypothetical protein C8R44DRAFT_751330 [Mycena epipterygia]|nr:hypothetical protein C8R44DRAFT_751330 [Mycena epipterygia]
MEPAPPLARPAGLSVSKVVAAAGKNRLQAYIEQIFDPGLVALGYYTDENAESWPSCAKKHLQHHQMIVPPIPAPHPGFCRHESHTVGGHSEPYSAYRFDLKSEAQLCAMEENCVLVNHLNIKPHRDRKNDSRRTSHYRQALERSEARNGLENIDGDIERSTVHTRELRAKKKELKAVSGVKQVKRRGEKEKERLPNENEFAGLSDSEDHLEFSQLPPTRPLSPLLHLPRMADAVASHGIQLDPALEPPFFPHESYNDSELFLLPGDITDYLPF